MVKTIRLRSDFFTSLLSDHNNFLVHRFGAYLPLKQVVFKEYNFVTRIIAIYPPVLKVPCFSPPGTLITRVGAVGGW